MGVESRQSAESAVADRQLTVGSRQAAAARRSPRPTRHSPLSNDGSADCDPNESGNRRRASRRIHTNEISNTSRSSRTRYPGSRSEAGWPLLHPSSRAKWDIWQLMLNTLIGLPAQAMNAN